MKDDLVFCNSEVWDALTESVKLQAHYAELLNMHDGGRRMIFKTPIEWIHRIRASTSEDASATKRSE